MADPAHASRTVLLIDDEVSVRTMLQAVLETENYLVETAVNAADARRKLAERNFDVVITDMRMETQISGYDVVRAARLKSPQPATIILTAFPLREEDWRGEGADAGLMKPVPIVELLSTVQHLVRSNGRAKTRSVRRIG